MATVTLRCMIDSFEKIRKIFHMFHGVLIPRSTLSDRVAGSTGRRDLRRWSTGTPRAQRQGWYVWVVRRRQGDRAV